MNPLRITVLAAAALLAGCATFSDDGGFGTVELDFTGVQQLGHGFADELFRVFARERPQIELLPVGMAPQVAAMVEAVRQTAG